MSTSLCLKRNNKKDVKIDVKNEMQLLIKIKEFKINNSTKFKDNTKIGPLVGRAYNIVRTSEV